MSSEAKQEFLDKSARRIMTLINSQLRSPTYDEIVREVGQALEESRLLEGAPAMANMPGCYLPPTRVDDGYSLMSGADEPRPASPHWLHPGYMTLEQAAWEDKQEQRRLALRHATTGISDMIRGETSLGRAVDQLEQEAEVEIRKARIVHVNIGRAAAVARNPDGSCACTLCRK